MVVICDVPMLSTGVIQERVSTPSSCTVQAPQSATPHPNFVPVMPSTSRNTQSSGVSPSTSTLWALPLILMVKGMVASEMTFSQPGLNDRHCQLAERVRVNCYCSILTLSEV